MTFKHVKFEDSPVMRSLERVAQQKGLVKADSLQKTAVAKKIVSNLVPTESLLDNVLRLCVGLRERGFDKQAEDLETHLSNYKKAQTLYETSPEKGEDVIEFAHPEGSHKLEGVDAKDDGAVFEDILDQMAKSIEMVNKKPTGKLSEAQKAIQAVKVTLGAAPLDVNSLYAQAQDALEKFRSTMGSIATMMGENASTNSEYLDGIKNVLDKKQVYQMTSGHLYGRTPVASILLNVYDNFKNTMEPSYLNPFGWGGPSAWSPKQEQAWQEVQKYFPVLKKYADRFHTVVSQINDIESGVATKADQEAVSQFDPEGPANILISKLQGLKETINTDISKIQQKKLPNANDLVGWLNKARDNFVTKYMQELTASDKGEQVTADYGAKYNNLKSKIDAFEQRWLA